jgi:hypothetical protein
VLAHRSLKTIGKSRSWSAPRLLALATTIHKYQYKEALNIQMQMLFAWYCEELETRPEIAENLGQISTAAYLLEDAQVFEKVILHLLMDYRGSYRQLHLKSAREILPYGVLSESQVLVS